VTQLVKKFSAFYGTQRFITVFTRFHTIPKPHVTFRNKLIHFGEEFSAKLKAGGSPLVGYPRPLIQYIRSRLLHLEAVSSIRNRRTRHVMV